MFHKPGSYPWPLHSFENQSCPGSTRPDGSPAVCDGWQGTGSVWKAADYNKTKRFVVNCESQPPTTAQPPLTLRGAHPDSQCPNKGKPGAGGQNISFATSTDMIHWTWLQDDWFSIDTTHYRDPGRWDCIAALPVPGAPQPGPVYGFWTGSPQGAAGPWGFGRSEDGIKWSALPPPQLQPPTGGEIGGVQAMTFGSPAQTRFFAMIGHGPMIVYSAEKVEGPYVSCHNIAALWVAFFSRRQRYCG